MIPLYNPYHYLSTILTLVLCYQLPSIENTLPFPPLNTSSLRYCYLTLGLYSNVTFQMYKRKDSDIFGTADLGYAPRIHNTDNIDPHAAFRKRTELNYERYQAALTSIPHTITARPLDACKVNEEAAFEEDYHRMRKEQDMQSSIFYPPSKRPPSARQD